MIKREELLEIIANGENSEVEFKRDDVSPEALARVLVAFANLDGGMVLLGVEDDGSISGIQRRDPEQWVVNVCRDKVKPDVVPTFFLAENVDGNRAVAIIRIPRGHSVRARWHNNALRYFVRIGSHIRDASQEELMRLFQERGGIRADIRPVYGASITDLDRRRLRYYYGHLLEQEVPDDEDHASWSHVLHVAGLMTDNVPNMGGMLLFGRNPTRFVSHAGIDAAAYYGTEKDYEAKERVALCVPMTPHYGSDGNLLEPGLVEESLYFINRNAPRTAHLDWGKRVDRYAYPKDALRESLVNALIHRDYLFSITNIELSVYNDRLEIVSSGKLSNGVTPEIMLRGVRTMRNPLLTQVMRDYRYLEHVGMGIPRKIVRSMKAHNGTMPELFERDDRFTLRLLLNPRDEVPDTG